MYKLAIASSNPRVCCGFSIDWLNKNHIQSFRNVMSSYIPVLHFVRMLKKYFTNLNKENKMVNRRTSIIFLGLFPFEIIV